MSEEGWCRVGMMTQWPGSAAAAVCVVCFQPRDPVTELQIIRGPRQTPRHRHPQLEQLHQRFCSNLAKGTTSGQQPIYRAMNLLIFHAFCRFLTIDNFEENFSFVGHSKKLFLSKILLLYLAGKSCLERIVSSTAIFLCLMSIYF